MTTATRTGYIDIKPTTILANSDISLTDDTTLSIGTGNDLTIVHNGTNTTITSATGNLTIDNTLATGDTIIQMGTDTTATSFQVRDNSGVAQLQVDGAGQCYLGSHPITEQVVVAPGTTNQTITIAQLLSGALFLDDPEGAGTWTLPTPALLVAGITDCRVGHTIGPIFIVNDATNASGEAITLAAGAGATAIKFPTGTAATITEGTSHYGILFIRVTNIGSGTENYSSYILTEG